MVVQQTDDGIDYQVFLITRQLLLRFIVDAEEMVDLFAMSVTKEPLFHRRGDRR